MYKNYKNQWSGVDHHIADDYIDFCKKASENNQIFDTFRSHEDYGVILEGGQKRIGLANLRQIKKLGGYKWFKENFNEIKKNDLYGNPFIHNFGDSIICSSSTIQYARDVYNCILLLKKSSKNQFRICEVGGGFGGFARLAISLLKIEKYYLIDQAEPLNLAEKYLKKYPNILSKVELISSKNVFEKIQESNSFDLFIASSSLAELDFQTQKFYFESCIKKSNNIFLEYNTIHLEGVEKFIRKELNELLLQGYNLKIHNPWFNGLFIYISKDFLHKKILGYENDKFWNYLHSFKFKINKLGRYIRLKLTGKY